MLERPVNIMRLNLKAAKELELSCEYQRRENGQISGIRRRMIDSIYSPKNILYPLSFWRNHVH